MSGWDQNDAEVDGGAEMFRRGGDSIFFFFMNFSSSQIRTAPILPNEPTSSAWCGFYNFLSSSDPPYSSRTRSPLPVFFRGCRR